MSLKRAAVLSPRSITLRIDDNSICIHYHIEDGKFGNVIGDTYVNFEPSKKLMEMLKSEIDETISKQKFNQPRRPPFSDDVLF